MNERSNKTKSALADSLKSLMKELPFEKISVEDISARAGLNRRTFYRHFLDKYDVLKWIYDKDFQFDFQEHESWTIVDYFPLFCQRLDRDADFYLKAFQISGQNGFREYCFSWLYPLFHKHTSDCFRSEEIGRRLLQTSTYITFDLFIDWLKEDPRRPPEEFAKTYAEDIRRYSARINEIYSRKYPTNR